MASNIVICDVVVCSQHFEDAANIVICDVVLQTHLESRNQN